MSTPTDPSRSQDPCPSDDVLDAVAGGMGVPDRWRGHLDVCQACRSRLGEAATDDTLRARVRSVMLGEDPPESEAESAPEIPGYRIEREIARGGQGVVYGGVQVETRRPVAIKLIDLGLGVSQRKRARFEREIEIAASLRHPNIVTVYEARHLADGTVGHGGGRHALVMEYVEGVPLTAWTGGGLSDRARTRRVVEMVRDAARGVAYAHGRGVIHRDLKPANILVDASGLVKVLDFGLAWRALEMTPAAARLDASRSAIVTIGATIVGEFQGTPAYAAPEQFDTDGSGVDVRTDVYALGLILEESLTGRRAFESGGTDLLSLARRKKSGSASGTPPGSRLEDTRRSINPDLRAVIERASAPARERRYASAAAFADDLDAWLACGAVSARRETWYRLRKFVRRHRWGVGTIGLVTSALAVVTGLTLRHNAALEGALLESDVGHATAKARAGGRFEAESRLWTRLLAADPGGVGLSAAASTDPALIEDANLRRLVWALMEVRAYHTYTAIRSLPGAGGVWHVLTELSGDEASFAGMDGMRRTLSLPSLAMARQPQRFNSAIPGASPQAIGPIVASIESGRLHTVNTRTGEATAAFEYPDLLAAGWLHGDHTHKPIIILTTATGKAWRVFPDFHELRVPESARSIRSRAFIADRGRVLYIDPDGAVRAFGLDDLADRPAGFVVPAAFRARTRDAISATGSLHVSPDGTRLLVLCDRAAMLLPSVDDPNAAIPPEATDFTTGESVGAAFSPDGIWLCAWSAGDPRVTVFDARTLRIVSTLDTHEGNLTRVRFAGSDHRWILTVDGNFTVRLWPVPGVRGADWRHALNDTPSVSHASWLPNGDLWLTLQNGSVMRFADPWETPTEVIKTPIGPTRGVIPLRKDASGRSKVLVAGQDSALDVFNADGSRKSTPLAIPGAAAVANLRLSPNGTLVAAGGYHTPLVRVWRTSDWTMIGERSLIPDVHIELKHMPPRVRSLQWSPDSRVLFASGPGGLVHRLDPMSESLAPIAEPLVLHDGHQVRNATPSPDGRTLVTLGDDRRVRLWDLPSMRARGGVRGAAFASDPFIAAFHPKSTVVAVGDRAGVVTILDTTTGDVLASFQRKGPVMALAFSPDGSSLAVGGAGGTDGAAEILNFRILADSIHASAAFWTRRVGGPDLPADAP